MTPTQRLVKMIRDFDPEFPDGEWVCRRVYAGYVQRSCGAFSFFLRWKGDPANTAAAGYSDAIGSQYPIGTILKNGIHSITSRYGDLHINPKEPASLPSVKQER